MIGLRQQRGDIEDGVVADDDADADGGDHRTAVDFAGRIGERAANLVGDGNRAIARCGRGHGVLKTR